MDLQVWLAYFVAAWVIAVSPGSGAVLSMTHGLAYGVRHASATILGLQAGLSVVLLIAGVGVGALLVASATAFTVIKVLGALYLVWLGWRQWVAPVADEPRPEPAGHERSPVSDRPPGLPSVRQRFLLGLFTNMTNPKGIVFMVAVLPQFMTDMRPLWTQLVVMAATTVTVDVVVMHGYAAGASALRRLMRSARAVRAQNRVFGGLLMAVGAGLFFVKRGGQHA